MRVKTYCALLKKMIMSTHLILFLLTRVGHNAKFAAIF